jgi:hypothetical protein
MQPPVQLAGDHHRRHAHVAMDLHKPATIVYCFRTAKLNCLFQQGKPSLTTAGCECAKPDLQSLRRTSLQSLFRKLTALTTWNRPMPKYKLRA